MNSNHTAQYLADTIRTLVPIAADAGFKTLSYLLGMASLEADHLEELAGPPQPEECQCVASVPE